MIFGLIFGYIFNSHSLRGFGFICLILLIYEIVSFLFDYILILTENITFKCIKNVLKLRIIKLFLFLLHYLFYFH